jgi:hypothetical protein
MKPPAAPLAGAAMALLRRRLRLKWLREVGDID